VEYAVMVALIAVVIIVTVATIGTRMNEIFDNQILKGALGGS
jgi:Flp pilus assembly pilin Flp